MRQLAPLRRKKKRQQSLDPGDPPYMHQHTRAELDSHADTCSFGSTCLVIENTGRTVSVEGFGEELGQVHDIPIVQVAVAYDCPITSQTYVLLFNEAL